MILSLTLNNISNYEILSNFIVLIYLIFTLPASGQKPIALFSPDNDTNENSNHLNIKNRSIIREDKLSLKLPPRRIGYTYTQAIIFY